MRALQLSKLLFKFKPRMINDSKGQANS